jgi:hypothetical protein
MTRQRHEAIALPPLPMSDDEFVAHARTAGVTDLGIELLQHVRHGDPARRTDSSPRSVAGTFASPRMGRGIPFDSHRAEFVWLWLKDPDPDTIEIHGQPDIKVQRPWAGRGHRPPPKDSIPDFLLVHRSGVEIVEVKAEDALDRLSEERPGFLVKDEAGEWHCPGAEAWCAQLGIPYRIVSTARLAQTAARNG